MTEVMKLQSKEKENDHRARESCHTKTGRRKTNETKKGERHTGTNEERKREIQTDRELAEVSRSKMAQPHPTS